MTNKNLINLLTHRSIEEFNAEEYFNEGKPLKFKAVGFNFSFDDVKNIVEKFNSIQRVMEYDCSIKNQILTITF